MTVSVRIAFRWWVKPYIWACLAFLYSIAWALDADDPRIGRFIAAQGDFIARLGVKVTL